MQTLYVLTAIQTFKLHLQPQGDESNIPDAAMRQARLPTEFPISTVGF